MRIISKGSQRCDRRGDHSRDEKGRPGWLPSDSALHSWLAAIALTTWRRQLDEKIKTRLRVRAAHQGRSMEAEARAILRSALTVSSPVKENLAEIIHRRFAALGGLEFKLPRRDAMRHGLGK